MTALDQNFNSLASLLMQRRQMQEQAKQDEQTSALRNLQIQGQQSQLNEQNAQRGALRQLYGANTDQDAYVKQLQAQRDAEETSQIFGNIKNLKAAGAPPEVITNWAKATLGNNPKYKDIVGGLTFIDDTGIELTKQFKDGELRDPSNPQAFLPAGMYKVKGKATGDAANPYAFSSVEPITPKPDQEALLDKRFKQQQELQERQIVAQDRRTQMQMEAADRRALKAATAKETAPGKPLPAGQLESIADMKRVKDVLAEASSDMETGKVSTGPMVGRLQSLGSKIGAADDDFVNVQQKLQTAQNIMLKLRSGAAVTESEYARFLKEYPTPNDPPAVFKRKMKNTIDYANTLMDDKMTIYEEGGYKVPKSVRSGGKAAPTQKSGTPRVTKGGFKITVVK